jgi:hypothetical protein
MAAVLALELIRVVALLARLFVVSAVTLSTTHTQYEGGYVYNCYGMSRIHTISD